MKISNFKYQILFCGIAILGVALFLRIYNLLSIPIFVDEAIYIRWSQVMRAVSALRFLPLSDGKQPLFMWSVIPFLKIFEDPLIAGRMVSVLCGMGSVIGISALTHILFKSWKTTLLAGFLYAISPFAVFFERMALADAMLSMFGVWSMVFAVLTAKYLRLDTAMLAGFALGGALLTKSPGVFFLILLPATIFLANLPKRLVSLTFIKLAGLWIVVGVISYGLYNILRLGPEFHMISLRNKDYIFPLSHALTNPWDPLQFHVKEIIEWFWVLVPMTSLLAAAVAIILGWKKHWRVFLPLLAWLLVPLIIQAEYAKVFTARYLLFTIPPLFILAALGITSVKLKTKTFWAVIALVSLPSLYVDYLFLTTPQKAPLPRVERSGYLELWTSGTGIREVAQFIKAEHEKDPNTQIVVGTEGYFGTLPDGLMIYVADIPKVVVTGVGLSISVVNDPLYEAKKAGNKVYLVANTSRMEIEPEKLGYNILASYPKAEQPNGKVESLLLLEVTEKSVQIRDDAKAKEEQEKQDVNKK
ncbi:MAG: Uncharacterized protein G01um10145_681 [Microgenomates group bacterium Gr01-1014_5]|nr:MAG: Uncharacterized protein G01um10145_681 [Microgenomates group bacterium Gr01-1014_5]